MRLGCGGAGGRRGGCGRRLLRSCGRRICSRFCLQRKPRSAGGRRRAPAWRGSRPDPPAWRAWSTPWRRSLQPLRPRASPRLSSWRRCDALRPRRGGPAGRAARRLPARRFRRAGGRPRRRRGRGACGRCPLGCAARAPLPRRLVGPPCRFGRRRRQSRRRLCPCRSSRPRRSRRRRPARARTGPSPLRTPPSSGSRRGCLPAYPRACRPRFRSSATSSGLVLNRS